MDLSWAVLAARYVQLVALVVLFGSALFSFYAAGAQKAPHTTHRDITIVLLALAATLFGAAVSLIDATEDVSAMSSGEAWSAFLLATSFGWVWVFRILALFALLIFTVSLRQGPVRAAIIALLSGALIAVQAWLGHTAAGHATEKLAAILAYDVHTLAVAAWLGGLVPLFIRLRSKSGAAGGNDAALGVTLRRFSVLGISTVSLIVVSGLANAALRLASPSELWTTAYGRVLTLKLGLFALILGCAAANRFIFTPRILAGDADGTARSALTRSVRIEQALALAILAVAVLLASTAPPH
jgi:putative copper export protein